MALMRYTIDLDIPADAAGDVKEQLDQVAVSVVRQAGGTITVSPTNGSVTARGSKE